MTTAVPRAGWCAACLLLALLLQSFFQQPVTWIASLGVLAYVVGTAWRPYAGLLLLAALGPVATAILAPGRGQAEAMAYAEIALLAFATGWTAHQVIRPEPLRVPLLILAPALFLATAAAASAVVQSTAAWVELQHEPAGEFGRRFLRDYVLHVPGTEAVASAARFAAGMLLVLAAAHLTAGDGARRTSVLRMMVLGAAVAVLFNFARIATVAGRRDQPLEAFLELFATHRFNVHYADLNAAGSYYALLVMVSVGVAMRLRVPGTIGMILGAAGLWMSGSRVALAAAAVSGVLALAWLFWRTDTRRMRTMAAGTALVLAALSAAIWIWYPAGRNIGAGKALTIRLDLARAGLEMARDHPVFGVGPGRYYVLSDQYAAETLEALNFRRENAHNNFVQIAAELGIPGFAAFLLLLVAAVRTPAGDMPEHPWLLAGLGAYLLTCLAGHPLLVVEAATPFWLVLGIIAAPAVPVAAASSRWRFAPAVLAVILVASIGPRAAAAARTANLEHVSVGLSQWQHGPDGSRYRWAGGRSTFYVTSAARAVRIPMQNAAADRKTREVAILLDGREADRILLPANDRWRVARLLLRPSGEETFVRVDLAVGPPGFRTLEEASTTGDRLVMVGRPFIER